MERDEERWREGGREGGGEGRRDLRAVGGEGVTAPVFHSLTYVQQLPQSPYATKRSAYVCSVCIGEQGGDLASI
jgi:hypothetical protein